MNFRFLVWMMVLGLMNVPSLKAADMLQIVVGEPGNSVQGLPFSSPVGESIRYQQVYDSSAFGPIPLRIFRLTFRTIPQGFGTTFIPDIQINLSTTTRPVDGLTPSFALNVGLDDTIVFNRGSLTLSSAGTGLFDIIIDLDTPFLYDPAQGNLLLDVSLFRTVGCCSFFDAENRPGDPISRVWASDVASDTSDFDDSVGLVTQFTVSVLQTVLVANFLNGNTDSFNSRVYLWNPSTSAGDVTVRVFTLPLSGGLVQELTDTPLNLGALEAKSALNVKLAEDVLVPLGITLPYTDNDGDLTLEFTIEAPDVRGAAQVFSDSLAFGTNPLQQIPSTSSGSPTILVANFTNGNTDFFKSRVYLWNPSQSAGNVTVRVFTLPLTGGLAQELPGTPLSLGTLAAKSALNIKLAENILTPLGITPPYVTDGGNLTVEFTIQAADVRGAAQVFSSDFAFGVYPLQEIPSTSGTSPTVLVANFTNGNTDAFKSRVYLWNPSTSAGDVSVRVFTLPLSGGTARQLTGGGVKLGRLGAKSALNVKLAEDILRNIGITTPYTDNGGNLTLEFTIQGANVRGTAQVFSSDFAFGTYPLQEIPSTSAGSPTVLVANFMNGNNTNLNSRIYLWNPSRSAGDVTVRVFSLPPRTGVAQELTGAPLSLGALGASSALNVKLAEDILIPLGIPTPYITDGGNLTLEFTITAANVRGVAQVFSDSLAFGTYPLEVIQ